MTPLQIPSHGQSLGPEMNTALQAALAAAQVVSQGADQIHEIEAKGVGDLVSAVDREADRVACEILAPTGIDILSEELHPDVQESNALWVVDPLDASSAFLMRAGDHYPTVLVALRRDGRTELGVVVFPLTGEWYYARRGHGAWCGGKRLVCDESEPLSQVWIELNQYGDAAMETDYFRDLGRRLRSKSGPRLVTVSVPNSGMAMRIARGNSGLAAAIHDNNPLSVKQAPWDIAAPQVILEEAGGVFINPQGEPSDPFRCEPIIVARSRALAEEIVALAALSVDV